MHRAELDLSRPDDAARTLAWLRPYAVLHLGGVTAVAAAAADPDLALRVNAETSGALARAAQDCGARMVFASTDFVFSGDSERPWREDDAPAPRTAPRTAYGRSKAEGEARALAAGAAVLRLPLLYGLPWPGATSPGVLPWLLRALAAGETVRAVCDEWRSPLHLADAAAAVMAMAEAPAGPRLLHAGGPQEMTPAQMFARAAALAGLPARLEPVRRDAGGAAC